MNYKVGFLNIVTFFSQCRCKLAGRRRPARSADIDTLIGFVTDVCTDCLYFIYFSTNISYLRVTRHL